jgi:hypothetical protein
MARKPGILRSSRLVAVIVVLAIHVAVIIVLLMSKPSTATSPAAQTPAVELVYLPPPIVPKLRAGIPQPIHITLDPGISLSRLPQPSPFQSAPAAQPDGDGGPGVNWIAEAHRAIKAYEIRRDEHVVHEGLGLSPWGGWLPEAQHYSGEKYRTASGDWVVWINGNCYQVAAWRDESAPPEPEDQTSPQTVCISRERSPDAPAR